LQSVPTKNFFASASPFRVEVQFELAEPVADFARHSGVFVDLH
jgi:hypothetical protein